MSDQVEHQGIKPKYTSTGRHSGWQTDLYHRGLDEHKHLSASERSALDGKIHNQCAIWEQKWDKQRLHHKLLASEHQASVLTKEAHEKIHAIENLLAHTLKVNDVISWETLMQSSKFSMPPQKGDGFNYNKKSGYPESIVMMQNQVLPHRNHFETKLTFWDKLFGKTDAIREGDEKKFQLALGMATKYNERAKEENDKRAVELISKQNFWKQEEAKFFEEQEKHNQSMRDFRCQYEERQPEAILSYCELVLEILNILKNFPRLSN